MLAMFAVLAITEPLLSKTNQSYSLFTVNEGVLISSHTHCLRSDLSLFQQSGHNQTIFLLQE